MRAKFGAVVVAGSGKIGGHVASKNKSGAYFRTKVTPSNPQTTAQLAVRGNFSSSSKSWGSLTDSQRASWNAAAQYFKGSNIFGDIVTPSGFNLYKKISDNLQNIGETPISTAPANVAPAAIESLAATVVGATHVVTLTFTPAISAGAKMVVMATAPQPAGKSFVKNLYRKVGVYDSTDVSPLAITADYAAKFGAPSVVGQKVYFKCFMVDIATGVSSAFAPAVAVIS